MAVPVAGIVVTGVGAAAGALYFFRDKVKALLGSAKNSTVAVLPKPTPTPTPNEPKVIVVPPPSPPQVTPPVPVTPPEPSDTRSRAITLSDLNVRTGMTTKAPTVSPNDAFKGRIVQVLDWNTGTADGYDWAKVITPGGATGYAAKKYLQPTDETEGNWTPTYQERKELHEENMEQLGGTYRPYLELQANGDEGYQNQAMNAARALYQYLTSFGQTRDTTFRNLVRAFQRAHNRNRKTLGLMVSLTENGLYSPATSAALTQYTGAPIAGNPNNRAKVATLGEALTTAKLGDSSNAGSAKLAQFNLRSYLQHFGARENDPNYVMLVREFQNAVNHDPLFPGVAYRLVPKPAKLVPALAESGSLDSNTISALNRG